MIPLRLFMILLLKKVVMLMIMEMMLLFGLVSAGMVHYHRYWDAKLNMTIKRVYESHFDYPLELYKFPERKSSPSPATIGLYVFASITFLLGVLLVAFLIYERKVLFSSSKPSSSVGVKNEDKELGVENQQQQQQPKEDNFILQKSNSISLQVKLGSGKFGTVWRASVEGLNLGQQTDSSSTLSSEENPVTSSTNSSSSSVCSVIAIKVFEAGAERSWAMEKLVYELPGMNHRNLLGYLGVYEVPKPNLGSLENPNSRAYCLATEYHQTGSLYDYLSRATLTVDQLHIIVHGLASGLAHLHEFKTSFQKPTIVLRDLKSKNVLLDDHLRPLIADFGLAVVFFSNAQDSGLPQEEVIGEANVQVGTPRYMAPEVLAAQVDFTVNAYRAVDMYALSLILWELLTRTEGGEDLPTITSYRPPFQEYLSAEGQGSWGPTVGEMRSVVVERKLRPLIQPAWFDYQGNSIISMVANSMLECWDVDAEARVAASTVMMRMEAISTAKEVVEVLEV